MCMQQFVLGCTIAQANEQVVKQKNQVSIPTVQKGMYFTSTVPQATGSEAFTILLYY